MLYGPCTMICRGGTPWPPHVRNTLHYSRMGRPRSAAPTDSTEFGGKAASEVAIQVSLRSVPSPGASLYRESLPPPERQRVMRSVPPRGSGWVSDQHGTRRSLDANITHPLPRGGTDLMEPYSGTDGAAWWYSWNRVVVLIDCMVVLMEPSRGSDF